MTGKGRNEMADFFANLEDLGKIISKKAGKTLTTQGSEKGKRKRQELEKH